MKKLVLVIIAILITCFAAGCGTKKVTINELAKDRKHDLTQFSKNYNEKTLEISTDRIILTEPGAEENLDPTAIKILTTDKSESVNVEAIITDSKEIDKALKYRSGKYREAIQIKGKAVIDSEGSIKLTNASIEDIKNNILIPPKATDIYKIEATNNPLFRNLQPEATYNYDGMTISAKVLTDPRYSDDNDKVTIVLHATSARSGNNIFVIGARFRGTKEEKQKVMNLRKGQNIKLNSGHLVYKKDFSSGYDVLFICGARLIN